MRVFTAAASSVLVSTVMLFVITAATGTMVTIGVARSLLSTASSAAVCAVLPGPVDLMTLLVLVACALFVEFAACVFVVELSEVVSALPRATMHVLFVFDCGASNCARLDSVAKSMFRDRGAASPVTKAVAVADCMRVADWVVDCVVACDLGCAVECAAFVLADSSTLPKPSLAAPDCAALAVTTGAAASMDVLTVVSTAFMPAGNALLQPNSCGQS